MAGLYGRNTISDDQVVFLRDELRSSDVGRCAYVYVIKRAIRTS